MEYKNTFKNEQGVELEIRIKAECATEESMYEALSFIAQNTHEFYLDVAKVCKEEMEAGKTRQEGTASKEPDFVGEPDIKLEGAVEDSCTMSQEKFDQMRQQWIESTPRCTFAEGNSSGSTGESLTAEGMKMPKKEPVEPKKHPYDILMDLSVEVPSILVKAAMGILGDSTQSEYVELAVTLLNDALKYDSLNSHARGYNELIWKSAEKIRNKREKSSQGAAV